MTKNEIQSDGQAADVNRREVLVGGAATAFVAAVPNAAVAQSSVLTSYPFGAIYMDPAYNNTFKNAYSRANIATVHRIIRSHFATRDQLKWGDYQKAVVPTKGDWGPGAAFDNWESFREEAREDLERQPATFVDPANCIDPLDPSQVAANLSDHLDEVVRIALWDYAIPIKIKVGQQRRSHHGLTTEWKIDAFPSIGPSLTIKIDCPLGGWQGCAKWRNQSPGANKISKLSASWMVPAAPAKNQGDQIIFVFGGLESISGPTGVGGILQPVLQWTKAGWLIRSMYMRADFDPVQYPMLPDPNDVASRYDLDGSHDNRTFSKGVIVQPDQVITGVVSLTGSDSTTGLCSYTCSLSIAGALASDTVLSISLVPELVYAVCAIESYYVDPPFSPSKADYYPVGAIKISSIDLETQQTVIHPVPWIINIQGLGTDYTTKIGPSDTVVFTPV